METLMQRWFTKMVVGLRKQGKKSYSTKYSYCCYRNEDGLKCAIGMLIPDAVYSESMEGCPAKDVLMECFPNMFFSEKEMALFREMQYCHDAFSPSQWEGKFQEIATKFSLTLPPL